MPRRVSHFPSSLIFLSLVLGRFGFFDRRTHGRSVGMAWLGLICMAWHTCMEWVAGVCRVCLPLAFSLGVASGVLCPTCIDWGGMGRPGGWRTRTGTRGVMMHTEYRYLPREMGIENTFLLSGLRFLGGWRVGSGSDHHPQHQPYRPTTWGRTQKETENSDCHVCSHPQLFVRRPPSRLDTAAVRRGCSWAASNAE